MTSKTLEQLGFPIWAHCVTRETKLLHVASVTWHAEGIFPLSIQPSTGSQGTRMSCASVPITSASPFSNGAWFSLANSGGVFPSLGQLGTPLCVNVYYSLYSDAKGMEKNALTMSSGTILLPWTPVCTEASTLSGRAALRGDVISFRPLSVSILPWIYALAIEDS